MRDLSQFGAVVRVFDDVQMPQLIVFCKKCLLFNISTNTWDCANFMNEHRKYPCPATLLSSDIAEELSKMLGEIK